MSTKTLSEELVWRGFVNQTTLADPGELDKKKFVFYFGVDPSAPSMTIGNLATAMMVRHFIAHGHTAILLVGGATGLIGDPDGKSEERQLKTKDEVDKNKAGIAAQYKRLFNDMEFELVDNYDWFKGLGYLEFLRDVGKHVPMRQMLGREFVQSRLSESGNGISYAEFSYSLIQGYDFLHLYKTHGASLQVCGADQWGNSIAGVELIRRIAGGEAHIWSAPLVVNKTTGVKFGKSEAGAVWLDENLTSVYQFYQFWLNLDDAGVVDYLKIYTLLDETEISEIEKQFAHNKGDRVAQKRLAYEVTSIVHGKAAAKSIERVSEVLFGSGSYIDLEEADFKLLEDELNTVTAKGEVDIASILVEGELASSKSEARRFLEGNAIYVNGQQIPISQTSLSVHDAIHGRIIVRRGKNTSMLVKIS